MKLKKLSQDFLQGFLLFYLLLINVNLISNTQINKSSIQKKLDRTKLMGFRCIGETGVETALRVNLNNEVECWSENGKECVFGLSTDEKCAAVVNINNKSKLKPLQCGMHHKELFGTNGYDNKGHWCHKGLNYFFGKYLCPKLTGLRQTVKLDKETGDVVCMSKDFVDCYEGKDANAVCGSVNKCKSANPRKMFMESNNKSNSENKSENNSKNNNKPVVSGEINCGDQMKEKLGHTGYQHPGDHWCKEALAYMRYTGDWLLGSQTGTPYIVRLGKKGSIECLSKDGKNCITEKRGDSSMENQISEMTNNGKSEPKVVVCGQHLPKGETGFEKPNSWCYQAYYAVLGLSKPDNGVNNNDGGNNNGGNNNGINGGNNGGKKKPGILSKIKDGLKKAGNKIKNGFNKVKNGIKGLKDKFTGLFKNKSKGDPKKDIPWRRTVFGPGKDGFNSKPDGNVKRWRATSIKVDRRSNTPSKPQNNPNDLKQIKANQQNKVGDTWRKIPYKSKDIAIDKKRNPPPKKQEPKDSWRGDNEMYKQTEKFKMDPQKNEKKEGYKGRFIPLMKQINFLSKQGESLGNGSKIRISHVLTRNVLHSHPIKYISGSKQQEVTCFWRRDDDDWWIIKGPKKIKSGDRIVLTHATTGKNLHTAKFISPTSHQQEVSGFGFSGKGDSNDYFKVIITQSYIWDNTEWKVGDVFKLVHINTGAFLHSHNVKTNVSKQQEVTGYYNSNDLNNEWTVLEKFKD